MPDDEDIVGTSEKLNAYYQAALEKGADPIVLMVVIILLVLLLVVGLKIYTDYRMRMARLRLGYSPEPGEERDSQKTDAQSGATDAKSDIATEVIRETIAPLLTLIVDAVASIRELTAVIERRDSHLVERDRKLAVERQANQTAHTGFSQNVVEVKGDINRGIGDIMTLFKSGYESVIQQVLSSRIRAGMVVLDKTQLVQAWNAEGMEIFGGKADDSDVIGQPIGASHSKCLGSSLDLCGIVQQAHEKIVPQVDVLELSLPGAEEGKWNWYLMVVLPFPTTTILLLADIGDVSRSIMPKKKKDVLQPVPAQIVTISPVNGDKKPKIEDEVKDTEAAHDEESVKEPG